MATRSKSSRTAATPEAAAPEATPAASPAPRKRAPRAAARPAAAEVAAEPVAVAIAEPAPARDVDDDSPRKAPKRSARGARAAAVEAEDVPAVVEAPPPVEAPAAKKPRAPKPAPAEADPVPAPAKKPKSAAGKASAAGTAARTAPADKAPADKAATHRAAARKPSSRRGPVVDPMPTEEAAPPPVSMPAPTAFEAPPPVPQPDSLAAPAEQAAVVPTESHATDHQGVPARKSRRRRGSGKRGAGDAGAGVAGAADARHDGDADSARQLRIDDTPDDSERAANERIAEASAADAHDADARDVDAVVEPPAPPPPPAAPDLRPPHSAIVLDPAGRPGLLWQPGKTCPQALDEVARDRFNQDGLLCLDDDTVLALLMRLARDEGHELRIAPELWLQIAWQRDALHRLHALERAHPQGPAGASLRHLLQVPLAPYQAEGALFAATAGRALIADEPGLGKTAQAIATAALMRRHVGIERVLVLCSDASLPTWRREWLRFAGAIDAAHTRISGASRLDAAAAAALAAWQPDLVIVDEPQRLGAAWTAVTSRHALVLCGTPHDCEPALLQSIVQYLDLPRRGAAWTWQPEERALLEAAMASLMIQRTREEVQAQLPEQVLSARIVPMPEAQRRAHDALAERAGELLGRWRRSGLLPDLDQWQLDTDLHAMQALCHRDGTGEPLSEATLQALGALLDELLPAGQSQASVAVCCPDEADLDRVSAHLGDRPGLSVVASIHDAPDEAEVLVRIGVPWRPARRPQGPDARRGRRCIHLVAERGIDSGLYDTLDLRRDTPRGMTDEGRGFLSGERLLQYLQAVDAALQAARRG